MTRVLVTGGAGFIGANLVRRLRDDPRVKELHVLDDLSSGLMENLPPDIGVTVGSVLDEELLAQTSLGYDSIVHLAAVPSVARSLEQPMRSHEANTTGTLMVLEAARRHGNCHVVVASSSSVYGRTATLPKNEHMPCAPASPYAASKLAAESYALAYARSFGTSTLALRFFNVFGPLQRADHEYAAVVPKFIDALVRGLSVEIHGDGLQTRDFTYVDTVAQVLCEAAVERVAGGPINLALGTRHSLLDVLATLEGISGQAIERRHIAERPGDVRDSQADATRLKAAFPNIRSGSLHEGLVETLAWHRQRSAPSPIAAVRNA